VSSTIVFETHSISEDNERGVATGWLPGRLSPEGRRLARELGDRRRNDGLSAVFTSDLRRAAETAAIAFDSSNVPVLQDWRLRECDYGELNGAATSEVHDDRRRWLDVAYPGGESWRQAVTRVAGFLDDVPTRWDGQRILVVGHVATRLALDHHLDGVPLEDLIEVPFGWRAGWEYRLR
jgi:2,3-bisphosphoglycerate-dependent phosphoglycerate mutase